MIIDELQEALQDYPTIVETLTRSLRPDFMLQDGLTKESVLEYAILKVANQIIKKQTNIKRVFNHWDLDRQGYLSASEVIEGLKSTHNFYLTQEETHLLELHLDSNQDGQVTCKRVLDKIQCDDFNKRAYKY